MPETPIQQADHTLAEPAYRLVSYLVSGNDLQMARRTEDFLYFLVCATNLDARDLVKAINEFTARKEG